MNTYVLFDDSNPKIHYTGPWVSSVAPASLINVGNSGSPMFETLHLLSSSNGTISLNFNGTGVAVIISMFGEPLNYTSQCFVDGSLVATIPDSRYPVGSNIQLCSVTSLLPGQQHELSVNVSVPAVENQLSRGDSAGFFFDYILVEPPTGMNIDVLDKLVTFNESPCDDQGFYNISPGDMGAPNFWTASADESQISCTISFTGISASWIGFYNPSMPHNPAQSFYQIDSGAPVPFDTIPATQWFVGSDYSSASLTHQTLFKTQSLPIGSHTMEIVSKGDNTTTPLTLQQVVVQASMIAPQPGTPTVIADPVIAGPSLTSSPPAVLSSLPSHNSNFRAIVGGSAAAAAVVFLMISIVCVCLIYRRRPRTYEKDNSAEDLTTTPFSDVIGHQRTIVVPRKLRSDLEGIPNPLTQCLSDPPVTKWTRHTAQLPNNSIPHLSRPPVSTNTVSDTEPREASSFFGLSPLSIQENISAEIVGHSVPREPIGIPTLADHIYEEDSGIRLIHRRANDIFQVILPPAYTMQ